MSLFLFDKNSSLRYSLSILNDFEITFTDLKSEGVGEVGKLDDSASDC